MLPPIIEQSNDRIVLPPIIEQSNDSIVLPLLYDSSNETSIRVRKKRNKFDRTVYNKEQISIMNEWIDKYGINVYLTKQQKYEISLLTKLSIKQVDQWFINTRFRLKQKKNIEKKSYMKLFL